LGCSQPHLTSPWWRVAKKQDHQAHPQVMQEGQDHLWLSGDPSWGHPRKHPIEDDSELPESWQTPTNQSPKGWVRQTLRPIAPRLVFPMAWSPFFLLITAVPLAIPDRTAIDDQTSAAIFFTLSWLLILVPLYLIRSSQPTHVGSIHTLPFDWLIFIVACTVFGLHFLIHPALGWLSYALFWLAWFRSYAMIRDTVTNPPCRWLLPVDSSDWKTTKNLTQGWKIHSEFWTSGPIAILDTESGQITLSGVSRGENRFISIALIGPSGFVHDPFSDASSSAILSEHRVGITGVDWPSRLLPL